MCGLQQLTTQTNSSTGRLKMQDWKMRHQESMESQPTRLLLIVVVVSDYQHGLCELKL